ncbi:MAG: cobalt ECF transporter T component CbiQ [Nitrospinae bacterium]|nr:cobalt ECF transporter T component CbiQ [Nitrospinota bacterium]
MRFEVFTDIFTYHDSPLRAVDARVKLLVAAVAVGLTLLAPSPWFPSLVFAMCLTALAWLKAPLRLVLARFAPALWMALMLLALKTVLTGATPMASATVAGITVTAYREGWEEGVLLAFRLAGCLSALQLFSMVTPAHEVFRSLLWFRAPATWVEVAMLMYRYTFQLFDMAAEMGFAQKARLGYSNARVTLASAGTLAGAALLRSVDQAARTHEAMRARCYTGRIPFDPMPELTARQALTVAGLAAALTLLFFAAGGA